MAQSTALPALSPRRERKKGWLARRYKPPRRLHVTREGWVLILVTVGVGAAAVNTGNNLLFLVLGLLLSLIVVSGLMSESTLRRIKIERHVPSRIHAMEPTLVEVTLRNLKKTLPSFSVELEDILESWSTDKRCYFLKVAPEGKQTAAYRTVIPGRGKLRFLGYRVVTRFPFALFEKWREIDLPGETIVFPALVDVPPAAGMQHQRGTELRRRRPGQGDEIYGLREHRAGDDSRLVHWPTSARRGQIMVRENEEDGAHHLCIYLDNARTKAHLQEETDPIVERAISIATSIAIERAAAGQGIHLAVRGDVGPWIAPGSSPERLLRFLALLDYAPVDPPEFGQLPPGETLLIGEADGFAGFDGTTISRGTKA